MPMVSLRMPKPEYMMNSATRTPKTPSTGKDVNCERTRASKVELVAAMSLILSATTALIAGDSIFLPR